MKFSSDTPYGSWCLNDRDERCQAVGRYACGCTPADPGADECAADAAGEWLADVRMDGDL